jgi:hypothetical protein
MSTIIATTLSNGSVSVPTVTVVNGSAKAWVNFNGVDTIAVRDSFNIASLTDNGTGDYSCNFSSAMGNANYAPTFGFDGTGRSEMRCLESSTTRRNTTALVGILINNNVGDVVDLFFVYASVNGDLA